MTKPVHTTDKFTRAVASGPKPDVCLWLHDSRNRLASGDKRVLRRYPDTFEGMNSLVKHVLGEEGVHPDDWTGHLGVIVGPATAGYRPNVEVFNDYWAEYGWYLSFADSDTAPADDMIVQYTPEGLLDNLVDIIRRGSDDTSAEIVLDRVREMLVQAGYTFIHNPLERLRPLEDSEIHEELSEPVEPLHAVPLPSWIVTLVKDNDHFSSVFYCQAPDREEAIGLAIRTYPGCEIGDVTMSKELH